ncbi:MAG TPA: TlpA disulfide reductase family protein [Acidobacteriaceae bacterium]|nr:TlpA disulfide reductase family protein [Acidobacteriaceae bacterium]
MKRNAAVLLVLAVVLAALLWAGWHNYERRKLAAENQPMQVVLVPSTPGDTTTAAQPSSANAGSEDGMKDIRGQAAPGFSLTSVDGQKVSLADYKGKAVLVNFWAVWCAPCKVEMPWFAEFRQKYAAQGFEVVGIAEDAPSKDEILKVTGSEGVNYPILFADTKVGDAYGGIDYLPESFYIGRDGKVVEETSGLASKDEVEANIKKTLATVAQ